MNLELDLLREQRDSIDDEVQRFEWALKQVRVALAGSAGMAAMEIGSWAERLAK